MADTMVYPTGCPAVGGTGVVLVYGNVPSNTSAGWSTTADTQTPAWQNVGTAQTPVWAPVIT